MTHVSKRIPQFYLPPKLVQWPMYICATRHITGHFGDKPCMSVDWYKNPVFPTNHLADTST